ncbi:FxsA family protein [Sulfitobacter donghicola]|uniref:Exlusion protein FxsA n=1 Tax=Sulfitobacter donghicola DSW-25 = KCTC 12864 = JCM 14565 TaxID=1300350 RepID=A0A073IM38_9RHOB|nr:FxsA family protein [Sulfitobacter donghicola]KEJ90640.1 exlusion protein FxsA [Sulfitobacter donghicola DSW-25 = KCTC 12864 = JCM 14565]KIN67889.1 FxsA protein [Sulfitobacter donghicola DSW-25 = KCTC 12864 = JCM 14565]
MWLLIAFIAVPVIEIALFIQVGGFIGLWPTLLIVILTAIAGTYLVRSQGLRALGQLQSSFGELRDPTEPLVHGAMILFSGALLLTPGFFTDAVGFALLIPGVRTAVFQAIRARVNIQTFGAAGMNQHSSPHRHDHQGDVIDGEFIEIPDDDAPRGNSGWTKN